MHGSVTFVTCSITELLKLKRIGIDTFAFLAVESNGIDAPPMRIYIRMQKRRDNANAAYRCRKIALKVVNDLVFNDRVFSLVTKSYSNVKSCVSIIRIHLPRISNFPEI